MRKTTACILGFVLFIAIGCSTVTDEQVALPTQPDETLESSVLAAPLTSGCTEGVQPSGALYRICMPTTEWNGELLLYAHGYVSPFDSLKIPSEATEIAAIANELGLAFATTSYRINGLAIREGQADLLELAQIFTDTVAPPDITYLVGASEGGCITALAVEQYPEIFDGGLAICGPVGDFQRQLDYFGDFWVVFDYFFPDLIPGDPINGVPPQVIDQWSSIYVPAIQQAISENPDEIGQVLRVTRAPIDRRNPSTIEQTVIGLLWYNVFTLEDAKQKLGGLPFGNIDRVYRGSNDDDKLNAEIARYAADPQATQTVADFYQTSGDLSTPLVTMHTTGDPIVPYWHEPLYRRKIRSSRDSRLHTNLPKWRYGHCEYEMAELLVGFQLLVRKVTGQRLDLMPVRNLRRGQHTDQ